MKIARRAQVPPFAVMEILAAANARRAAGQSVISLCAGQPGAGAPAVVRERAAALLADGDLGYTEAIGVPALRLALAEHYGRWYDVDLDPARVAITTGSSGAFLLAFLAAFEPGDRVALARPGYPAYRNILRSLGVEVVELDCGADTRFQPTPSMLAQAYYAGGLDGLVLASPANPTGTMVTPDELTALAAWCAEFDVRLVSDEIYHGITYPPPATSGSPPPTSTPRSQGTAAVTADRVDAPGTGSFASALRPRPAVVGAAAPTDAAGGPSRASAQRPHGAGAATAAGFGDAGAVVVSSFSKYWAMTGWRLGWMVLPPDLVPPIEALAGNLALCPPALAQHAAVAALSPEAYAECDALVDGYARSRDLLLRRLPELGWSVAPPDGAFYLYADLGDSAGPVGGSVGRVGDAAGPGGGPTDSVAWCEQLLEDTGVALTPGTDFDGENGRRYVRLSFAASVDLVDEAIDRIVAWQATRT